METDPALPPDHDPDQDQDDDAETIILDDGEEGPEEEGAGGGHVDPVGATETTSASVSSEVREAINQAYLVSEGKVPPAKTINIAPLPDFPSPAPQVVPPTAGLQAPRALSQQDRGLIKKAVAKVWKPQRRGSRPQGPCPQLLWCPQDSRFGSASTSTTSTASFPAPRPWPSPFPLVGAGNPLPCQQVALWASLLQV